jgi:hypothetical protein
MPAVVVILIALLMLIYIVLPKSIDRWAAGTPPRAKRFSCPKCDGTSWGSAAPFDYGKCYGCGWCWPRAEDSQYFHAP